MSFETTAKFNITPSAQADIDDAVYNWAKRYGEKSADRFLGAIEAIEDLLEDMPYGGHQLEFAPGFYEKTVAKNYQYSFYYTLVGNDVVDIVAFAFISKLTDPEDTKTLLASRSENYDFRKR